ncbi:uncharacterized protein MICPUCDRAFT_53436 [Micromonas pusilla CCMP1545]|uniref:Predicted protein n=1 Tax=Micromonas pusilla (strain CCMP1545) TaxID=564608 RepID=C1N6T7_MICPC|nr:uncharacterized protein MICPUCDRAFT_53436 [Micromonas pusilla CCMP1545]EEH51983.1 predicted protein [Micromonas pusilla CCMP1545]|eukprot:XP_003063610.1 predicted protein [Micromonas pusilla CCMP1545]
MGRSLAESTRDWAGERAEVAVASEDTPLLSGRGSRSRPHISPKRSPHRGRTAFSLAVVTLTSCLVLTVSSQNLGRFFASSLLGNKDAGPEVVETAHESVRRMENCGDHNSSCYVGANAHAVSKEDAKAEMKYGQPKGGYKPTPVRGQTRLDALEPLDVIRPYPGGPPLNAKQMLGFFRNTRRRGKAYSLKFYEKDGVVHFIYSNVCADEKRYQRRGAQRNQPWPSWCNHDYVGTYFARTTDAGDEEWVRCTNKVPMNLNPTRHWGVVYPYTIDMSEASLRAGWISCPDILKDPYRAKETLPEGAAYRREDGSWGVVGADAEDDTVRSPAEVNHEYKYNILGLPVRVGGGRCWTKMPIAVGGAKLACGDQGYDYTDAGGNLRRYVTPTWENGMEWRLLTRSLEGESNAFEKNAVEFLDFDVSPAYPGALFVGGLDALYASYEQSTDIEAKPLINSDKRYDKVRQHSYVLGGVSYVIMWEPGWVNPYERGSANVTAPPLPGVSSKRLILGRWREPQLPWSTPRNFAPTAYIKEKPSGYEWDAPSLPRPNTTAEIGDGFTVAAYVWMRHFRPVFQNASSPPSTNVLAAEEAQYRHDTNGRKYASPVYNGTTTIDWANYHVEVNGATVGNILHMGVEFDPEKEPLPSAIDHLPPGAIPVKGFSLYAHRDGTLVLAATDKGTGKMIPTRPSTSAAAVSTGMTITSAFADNEPTALTIAAPARFAKIYTRTFSDRTSLKNAVKECGNKGCEDMNSWDVSKVTDMSNLFHRINPKVDDISEWNVSKVTNMQSMFSSASSFNGDISKWDTSKVTNMQSMFSSASSFNGDISKWDTSKVTNMQSMFLYAKAFNGDISKWDTSKVTNMQSMFFNAEAFNGDISKWDTSKVTNMQSMFYSASSFNGDISNWDVSKVTNMQRMFFNAKAFNGDISKWDVSKVTNMGTMFSRAKAFNGDISKWDVSKVTTMTYLFSSSNFDQDLSNWNLCKLTKKSMLSYQLSRFKAGISNLKEEHKPRLGHCVMSTFSNGDMLRLAVKSCLAKDSVKGCENMNSWDVSKVTDMYQMFYGASAFNGDISNWDVSSVTNMRNMFFGASSFNGDISKWDVSKVTNMERMFYGARTFNGDISKWDVSKVTNMGDMFNGAKKFKQDLSDWVMCNDDGTLTLRNRMFANGVMPESYKPRPLVSSCAKSDASVGLCKTKQSIDSETWHSLVVAVSATSVDLYVGGEKMCTVETPNGSYFDGTEDIPVYTQCRGNECRGGGDKSRSLAAPHLPAAAVTDVYDMRVQFGAASIDPADLVAAIAARAAFEPPNPDAWKARCLPDGCEEPNMFVNHVPIPQGRWTRIPDPRSLKLYGCKDGSCADPHWCCEGKHLGWRGGRDKFGYPNCAKRKSINPITKKYDICCDGLEREYDPKRYTSKSEFDDIKAKRAHMVASGDCAVDAPAGCLSQIHEGFAGACPLQDTKALRWGNKHTKGGQSGWGGGSEWSTSGEDITASSYTDFKVTADGNIHFASGDDDKHHIPWDYDGMFAILRGKTATCELTGLCGEDFDKRSYAGRFELDDAGSIPKWRSRDVIHGARIYKTGDHEDIVILHPNKVWLTDRNGWAFDRETDRGKPYSFRSWRKETKHKPGAWVGRDGVDDAENPIGQYAMLSGRSVTHYGVAAKGWGFAHRRFIDGSNTLQSPYMDLATSQAKSPWLCSDILGDMFSPDGGYTYYAVMQIGYNPATEPAWRCLDEAGEGADTTHTYEIFGIRRLVTDECKPLTSPATHYGFASYLGNMYGVDTKVTSAVSRRDGDFLLGGQMGALNALGSNTSLAHTDLTEEASGCADTKNPMPGIFNESTGHQCMAQILTLEGAGCGYDGAPELSCGSPKSVSYVGSNATEHMRISNETGTLIIAGPDGVLGLNHEANAVLWNACAKCDGGVSNPKCAPLCGLHPGKIRVAIGPRGRVAAVLAFGSEPCLVNNGHIVCPARTSPTLVVVLDVIGGGNEMARLEVDHFKQEGKVGDDFPLDVAVSDVDGLNSGVYVGGFKQAMVHHTPPAPEAPYDRLTRIAFLRKFDANVRAGERAEYALRWSTWDYAGSDLDERDGSDTQITQMVLDRSGRLVVGGETNGFEKESLHLCLPGSHAQIITAHTVFIHDGSKQLGSHVVANRISKRPKETFRGTNPNSDLGGLVDQLHAKVAYVAIVDPVLGVVLKGQFLMSSPIGGMLACPDYSKTAAPYYAVYGVTLKALDVDGKGNIVFGGEMPAGAIKDLAVLKTNNRLNNRDFEGSDKMASKPYIAIMDPNLITRPKWTYVPGKASGKVTGIAGGVYCPDDVYHFGACTSALLVEQPPSEIDFGKSGAFYTTANALQVRSIHWSPYDRVGVVNAVP